MGPPTATVAECSDLPLQQRRLDDALTTNIKSLGFMHSFNCYDHIVLFCFIIIFFRTLSIFGLNFHLEFAEKSKKLNYLIKSTKSKFDKNQQQSQKNGFRVGRQGVKAG